MPALRALAVLGLCVLGLAACDDAVDPTLGTDQAFTIWGALDPTADQQAIRVVPIQGRIDADPTVIDAEVTATDVASGEAVAFRDSLVTFDNGTVGHVFVADWTPQFGRTYRFEARRTEDGSTSSVEVETPPRVTASVGEAVSTLEDVTYPFDFGNAPNVFGVRIELYVTGVPGAPDDTTALEVPFPSGRAASGGIEVAFVSTVRRFLSDRGLASAGLGLVRAELVAFVANAEWSVPAGTFDDEDAIVEPGTISNVTNGFGFVGGGYFTRTPWTPSVTTQIRAGFGSSEDAASRLWINEMSVAESWVELYNPLDEEVAIGGYSFANAPAGGDLTTLPAGTVAPARGFLRVDLTFLLEPATTLFFLSGAQREVLERNVEDAPPGQTFGSYPDGGRLIVRFGRDIQDFMAGTLVPTPGAPNTPALRYALLNELYTEGDGWAEVLVRETGDADTFVRSVRVVTVDRDMLDAPPVPDLPATGLAVVDEDAAAGLDLPQTGGAVYVLVEYAIGLDGVSLYRVMDYRRYALQIPGASSGRIPDGGDWREGGLVPTRGAANASSRPF